MANKAVSDLRSQLKATSLKKLRQVIDHDDSMIGANSNEYLNLVDNKTLKIRIFPAHPGNELYYIAKKCYWLSVEGSNGEMRRTTVLDSKVHGGTKEDLVEEYVKYAQKKYSKNASKIECLTESGKDSKSLNPSFTWLCYADIVESEKTLEPKIWEFKKMVRDGLNKLSFSEDESEAIEVDPFTDVDEGLPVLVKFMKNPNKKKGENFYEVTFPKKPVPRPLTDEEIEHFLNCKPISQVISKYGIKEFEKALEGLQNFDEENSLDLFSDEKWLEIVERIKEQYEDVEGNENPPTKGKKVLKKSKVEEEEEEEEKPVKKGKKSSKPEPEPEEEEEEEEEEDDDEDEEEENSLMSELEDLDRSELKDYIKKNSLDIKVVKSMTEEDIRNLIVEKTDELKNSDEDEEDEDEEDEEEKPVKNKLTLSDIRKKLKS